MMKLSTRIESLNTSPTLQVKAQATRLREQGVDVLDFGPGEPDFDTPQAVRQAAKEALDAGDTHYGPAPGKKQLRAAIAQHINRLYGGGWDPAETLVGVGGKGVLFLAIQTLVDPGDEVLVYAPYWVSFPEQVKLAGGKSVFVPTDASAGFVPDPQEVARRIGPRTRAIILNSPSNPSGAVIPGGVLEELADLAGKHGLWLISDETYDRFVYPGFEFHSCAPLRSRCEERLVLVNSFSKTYAMTGWRIGYGLAPQPVIGGMTRLQSHDATHATSFAQSAAVAALEGDHAPVEAMLQEYTRRRQVMVEGLSAIPGMSCQPPGGAFYVFPEVRELARRAGCSSSAELTARLLDEALVAVVPGEAFGVEGFVRLSYALSVDRIEDGLGRLRRFAEASR
jgi:aspartate aminotransferase